MEYFCHFLGVNFFIFPFGTGVIQSDPGNYWYFVKVNNQIVFLHVVKEAYKKYLRTDPDKTKKNNLDDLPDCY